MVIGGVYMGVGSREMEGVRGREGWITEGGREGEMEEERVVSEMCEG